MSTPISDLVDYLKSAPQGFVGFPEARCKAGIEDLIKMQADNERMRKELDVLAEFEWWLSREIDYLQSIGRTEFGDGGLATARKAQKEIHYIRNRPSSRIYEPGSCGGQSEPRNEG